MWLLESLALSYLYLCVMLSMGLKLPPFELKLRVICEAKIRVLCLCRNIFAIFALNLYMIFSSFACAAMQYFATQQQQLAWSESHHADGPLDQRVDFLKSHSSSASLYPLIRASINIVSKADQCESPARGGEGKQL